MNVVNLIGNLGKDPEIKYFDSGSVCTSFSIALSSYNTNTQQEVTHWIECKAWGKTAENIGEYFKAGHKIGVTGELTTDTWQDENQQNRKKTYVRVTRFDFLTKKNDSEQPSEQPKPAKTSSSAKAKPKPANDDYTPDDDEIPF